MTVFLLVHEYQNEHGYIDTSVNGVYRDESAARAQEAIERRHAREQGLIVEDIDSPAGEWQVSWKVEEYAVS